MTLKSDQVEPSPSLSFSAYRWLFGILREAFWGPKGLFLNGKIIHSERSGWHTERKTQKAKQKKTKIIFCESGLWMTGSPERRCAGVMRENVKEESVGVKGECFLHFSELVSSPPSLFVLRISLWSHISNPRRICFFISFFFFALGSPQKPRSPAFPAHPLPTSTDSVRVFDRTHPGGCGRSSMTSHEVWGWRGKDKKKKWCEKIWNSWFRNNQLFDEEQRQDLGADAWAATDRLFSAGWRESQARHHQTHFSLTYFAKN